VTVDAEDYRRETVQKVDLWSVTKLSLCFYFTGLVIVWIVLLELWLVADAVGIASSIEKFTGALFGAKSFHFLTWSVLRVVAIVGLVIFALQVIVTVISGKVYNVFAELFGGVNIMTKRSSTARRSRVVRDRLG